MSLNESIVEDAALTWFGELGYAVSRRGSGELSLAEIEDSRGGAEQCSTPAGLAEKVGVARATMTGLLDTLEKDGVVSRGDDLHDRRTVVVRLTDSGRALLEKMLPDYFATVARIMQPLNAAEQRQLVRLLQKIQQGLLPDEPSAAPLSAAAV